MNPILTIPIDKLAINSLSVAKIDGPVEIDGQLTSNSIITDTLYVNNLVTDSLKPVDPIWHGQSQDEIIGKGLEWAWPAKTVKLSYQDDRIWLNSNIDIADSSYKIDNVTVLSSDSLGPGVVFSHLKTLGTLTSLSVRGSAEISENLTVDTLYVKNLVSKTLPSNSTELYAFNESDLYGKGLSWTWESGSAQLIFRDNNRLWTNSNFDIGVNSSYKIDNIPVLSASTLGPSITTSNLKKIGTLNSLKVLGDVELGEFAFFNSSFGRLGLGTEEPSAAISIAEYGVEVSFGTNELNAGIIGTHSNHDLQIVSDNITRLTVKQSGEVHIGDVVNKQGILRVFGTLYADNLVSDTRIERTSPVQFIGSKDQSIYNNGLMWSGTDRTRQLVLKSDPDRLWSSESIDIAENQSYYISNMSVLSKESLGISVLHSNLITLGTLNSLSVNGDVNVNSAIKSTSMTTDSLSVGYVTLSKSVISSSDRLSIRTQDTELLYLDSAEIVIGNKQNPKRPVKIFGQLTVGVNNPDPTLSLAVSGNISFNNKKFITGVTIPTSGSFLIGDICWNENPKDTSYVGWICISSGTPGEWKPFGLIGS